MDLRTRIEQIGPEHLVPYSILSQAEYGDRAAVSQVEHLRWKFIDNPQGPSIGIHLYSPEGELVGRMVALTRQFTYEEKIYRGAHIVDFLVHPKARGMVALLQLATALKKLSGFDFFFVIAPNPAGAAVWEKLLKMQGRFDLDVMVAPLRPISLLQSTRNMGGGKVLSIADRPWQFLVGSVARLSSHFATVQVDENWPKSGELDQMFATDAIRQAVGMRSADYLDWRYRRSPVFKYNLRFFREHGKLAGYLVTRRTNHEGVDCLFVVDAFCRSGTKPRLLRAVLRQEIYHGSKSGLELVMIMGNTAWPHLAALESAPFLKVPPRFLPRKTAVFVEWLVPVPFEIRRNNFYVSLGDSDVI